MQIVWKYHIAITHEQFLELPENAVILSVMVQNHLPCIWVKVDPQANIVRRRIHIYGTGHPITIPALPYIGSFQMNGGALVFHVFG